VEKQAGSIEPSDLKEVAGLVKQAAHVIDQMLTLNTSIDLAAANAVSQYRKDARSAEDAAHVLASRARAQDSDREALVSTLTARVEELEDLVARQKGEIEALRLLVWPNAGGMRAKPSKAPRSTR
jgi:uncharacterized protein (DUF4213/DUF364 family)